MHHECFCATMADHLGNPAVARALDRLRDEVTIAECVRSTPAETSIGRRRNWQQVRSIRKKPHERILAALGDGPLPLSLLVDEVYGLETVDADEANLRNQRIRAVLSRLSRAGQLVRVGHGFYALPDCRDRMKHRTRGDCLRILSDPRVQPAGGLTVHDIAARLDVNVGTVRVWLQRLREDGAPIVGRIDRIRSNPWRWWVAREGAA